VVTDKTCASKKPLPLAKNYLSFGKHNSKNNLHGKGIKRIDDGSVNIGYWTDGSADIGNYVSIDRYGQISVGERSLSVGGPWMVVDRRTIEILPRWHDLQG
jgi:hypothetical protein